LTGFGGLDDEQVGRRDDIGRDFAGVRIGTQFNPSRRMALYGSILYQYSRYGDDDPFFQQRREDHYYVASVGLRYALDDNWSVRPEISYSRNDSKLAVNDYRRVEGMIYIRNDF
jgi:opacity protein-like surface antigen